MKINEKTMYAFANSRPVDREGFLMKRGEVNKAFQKRWFVLKGNLLFYYEKRGLPEPLGMIILEGCLIELCEFEEEKFCFSINFPGNRRYVLAAENFELMEAWMKSLTTAGYDYMRLMISELQRQLSELDSSSTSTSDEPVVLRTMKRDNPFNRDIVDVPVTSDNRQVPLRKAPPPPLSSSTITTNTNTVPISRDTNLIKALTDDNELFMTHEQEKDDFNFLTLHEYFGKSWRKFEKERLEAKEKLEQPLIVF